MSEREREIESGEEREQDPLLFIHFYFVLFCLYVCCCAESRVFCLSASYGSMAMPLKRRARE